MSGQPSLSKSPDGHSHGAAQGIIDARLVRDVGERAVAVVVEEAVGVALVVERAGEGVGGEELALGVGIELQVVAHEEIELAVAVVVDPGRAGAEVRILHARLGRHVGKGPVAVVVVEDRRAPVGDVDVLVAVVVVVAHGHAHAEALAAHARLRGDVGKGSVAVVAVEMIGGVHAVGLGKLGDAVNVAAADHVEVQQAVIVVVDPGAAGTGGLHDRTELLLAEGVLEVNAGFLRDVLVGHQRRAAAGSWARGSGRGPGGCVHSQAGGDCREDRIVGERIFIAILNRSASRASLLPNPGAWGCQIGAAPSASGFPEPGRDLRGSPRSRALRRSAPRSNSVARGPRGRRRRALRISPAVSGGTAM